MPKKKAPAKLTGGTGFRREDQIAARFLLDLIGATNSFGPDFGRVTRLDWQARDAGWLADDLAVVCNSACGERGIGVSIKSDRQVTVAGFPESFVEIAWGQWLGEGSARRIREGSDAIVLVTGWLANDVEVAWSNTLSECLQTSPERMVARLSSPVSNSDGSLASALQRSLFSSFQCPERYKECADVDDIAAIRLLRHVRILHFDFAETTSRDQVRALADCQQVLRSGNTKKASALWDALIGLAGAKRTSGGSATLTDVLTELRGKFDLRDHPDYQQDWESLNRRTQEEMADVLTAIAGLPPLPRQKDRASVQASLDDCGGCLLVGESGSGKSALAKGIAEDHYERAVWPTGEILDCDNVADVEQRLALHHPIADMLSASPKTCLFVFDGVERYSDCALRIAARLIRDLKTNPGASHVHVLLTVQFESSRRLITRLAELGVPLPVLGITPIQRPSENEMGVTGIPKKVSVKLVNNGGPGKPIIYSF